MSLKTNGKIMIAIFIVVIFVVFSGCSSRQADYQSMLEDTSYINITAANMSAFDTAYQSAYKYQFASEPLTYISIDELKKIILDMKRLLAHNIKEFKDSSDIPQTNLVLMYMSTPEGQRIITKAKEQDTMASLPITDIKDYINLRFGKLPFDIATVTEKERLGPFQYDESSDSLLYPAHNDYYQDTPCQIASLTIGEIEANRDNLLFNVIITDETNATAVYTIILHITADNYHYSACYLRTSNDTPVIRSIEQIDETYFVPSDGLDHEQAFAMLSTTMLDELQKAAANRSFTLLDYQEIDFDCSVYDNNVWRFAASALVKYEGSLSPFGDAGTLTEEYIKVSLGERYLTQEDGGYFYHNGQDRLDHLQISDGKLLYMPALQMTLDRYFSARNMVFTNIALDELAGLFADLISNDILLSQETERIILKEIFKADDIYITSAQNTITINSIKATVPSQEYEVAVYEWTWFEYGGENNSQTDTMGYGTEHMMTIIKQADGTFQISGDNYTDII